MISYDEELAKTRNDLRTLTSGLSRGLGNVVERVRLAYRQFHLASLTELEADYQVAQQTVSELIGDFGPQEDVLLLQANIDGRFHRLDRVKQMFAMSPQLAQRHCGRAILADIDFQEGRYQRALDTFQGLIEEERTWDVLARLAHWNGKMGEPAAADRLYAEAESELTAKEMRSFTWLELQRAALALSRGQLRRSRQHCERAAAAFPGYWRVDHCMVAVLAAEGDLLAAESLLRGVVMRAPRPELMQALGELLAANGKPGESAQWLERAASAFLTSVKNGGVHYYHHLADLYADSLDRPEEAVHWAGLDVALRSNFTTQSALAWALYQNAQIQEGVKWIEMALASGVQDASVFGTAAELFRAAGDAELGHQYERLATRINPSGKQFHLHI